eukprot:TRINITY_DN8912_c0_g1_i1.p2 TRINITY_DN8912_c0_g1~~TRINITY_DN8912_c0_g1_i1.p2  ORF type:complete len:251 (-),score=31.51 TRINITY_DN8912_c0_g1_i1:80-832(-)
MGQVVLDDSAITRILSFTTEPRGRVACKYWDEYLNESLSLQVRAKLNRLIAEDGIWVYHHTAVRELGDQFEECVAYQFDFKASGYEMQWTRTFDGWTSINERQCGHWTVVGDQIRCETTEGPEVAEGQVRYAPAGRVVELPADVVLKGRTAADGTTPDWEYAARGIPHPRDAEARRAKPVADAGGYQEPAADFPEPTRNTRAQQDDFQARFVQIDGDIHQVSNDIVQNWPESEWERLMKCRLRFGITGPV